MLVWRVVIVRGEELGPEEAMSHCPRARKVQPRVEMVSVMKKWVGSPAWLLASVGEMATSDATRQTCSQMDESLFQCATVEW